MRLSSSLPPAGFTRAEPSPPARSRVLRAPWPLLAAVVLVLGSGLTAAGYGQLRTAGRTVTPDAVTQPPPATPPPATPPAPPATPPATPPAGRSAPGDAATAAPSRKPARPRERPGSAPRPPAAPHRTAAPHGPRPRPAVRGKTRSAHPAPPSWIAAECRRRFPDDALRRRYCVAAYVQGWKAAHG